MLTFGTVDFLKYLQTQKLLRSENQKNEQPLKIGVISNFDSRLDALLQNMKLYEYFDFVLGSFQAGFEKPDKEIFLKAMEQSGLKDLKPCECLHIGDTPVTDYFGAKDAGWSSILVHEKTPEQLLQKYGERIEKKHVFGNFLDVHKFIVDNKIEW